MRKNLIAMALIPALALFLTGNASAKELKIAYINSERILNESQDYKDAKKILEEEEKNYSKQARNMELDIQNLEDEIEAQGLMWSEEKKIEKQQEAQNIYLKYQQFLQDIWGQTGKLYQRNLELSKPIVDKINDVITRIGEAEGYDMIFDGAAGNLVYAKPEFDLTDRIIEELKKK
jgi:outer membrane protein